MEVTGYKAHCALVGQLEATTQHRRLLFGVAGNCRASAICAVMCSKQNREAMEPRGRTDRQGAPPFHTPRTSRSKLSCGQEQCSMHSSAYLRTATDSGSVHRSFLCVCPRALPRKFSVHRCTQLSPAPTGDQRGVEHGGLRTERPRTSTQPCQPPDLLFFACFWPVSIYPSPSFPSSPNSPMWLPGALTPATKT